MQRVSIETAAALLSISPRLLRQRIEKKTAPIRLLGGPGPAAVSFDAVLQYKSVMPPTKTNRKPTNVQRLAKRLTDTRSLLAQAEQHARSTKWS